MAYLDVLFPESISNECTVIPQFNNVTTKGMSGRRDVQMNWDAPLRRYDVSHMVKDRSTLAQFIDFWITVRGTAYSFRFWDPSDYECGTVYVNSTISYVDKVTIGTGDGVETEFQLVKRYGGVINPLVRKITKPDPAVFRLYVNNVHVTTGFTLDAQTGIVTFSSPVTNGHVVAWAGHFWIEAYFENSDPRLVMSNPQVGDWTNIVISEERV